MHTRYDRLMDVCKGKDDQDGYGLLSEMCERLQPGFNAI
jgi:hypothetical protein